MKDKVHKLIELTGASTKSIEDAVNLALKRAGKSIKNLSWFHIVETRGASKKTRSNTGRPPSKSVSPLSNANQCRC